jgi:hypothetical protein
MSVMREIDKWNILDDEVFAYRASKDDRVFLYWRGKQVKVLKGKEAQRFIDRITNLHHEEAQLVMAKATGNFKRGNER